MTDKHTLVERLMRPIPYTCPPGMRVLNPVLINPDGPEAATRITALEAENAELVERLGWYANTFCEQGPYSEVCGRLSPDECAGCLARATLAKHQGEG